MDILKIANEIEKIARNAGQLILHKEELEIKEKSDAANIVTNMDIASQHYIIEECTKLIPSSCFYAEEEDQRELGEEYTWVIDPIDGTTNYAYDYKHSCISIALLYKKKGIIGVIYDPYLDECFVGIEGKQSTWNGVSIQATDHDAAHALVLFASAPYNKELADITFDNAKKLYLNCRDVRRSGSAALDICYVACGRVDAYYEERLSPWDYAAGYVIAKQAQVEMMGLRNEELDFTKPIGVLFASPSCFKDIRKMIGE